MSSPATGPYQSKLFNFVNRQSRRWRDRLGTVSRHLKVTAEWGVQVMLYPIYLLVQAGRMAGQELQQAVTKAQLPAAGADAPTPDGASDHAIVQVLKLVPNEPAAAIQGIASLCDSRRLALVTKENSLLDILSSEQERTLLAHIRTEIANYWYDRRLAQRGAQKLPGAIPKFAGGEAGEDKVLPPARFFWKVMGWIQRSPLAIATNLFGESRFTGLPDAAEAPALSQLLPSEAFVATLDNRIAEVEIAPLATAKRLFQQFSQQLRAVSQQHFQPLIAKVAPAPLHQKNIDNFPQNTDPFAIQALILAAVDYFFGQRTGEAGIGGSQVAARGRFGGKKNPPAIEGESPTAFSLLQAAPENENPWLTWEDLFGNLPAPAAVTAATVSSELPPSLPGKMAVREVLGAQHSEKSLEKKPISNPSNASLVQDSGVKKASPIQNPSPPTPPLEGGKSKVQNHLEVVPAAAPPDSLETAFDWLEAEVTSAGYVKHPLEQILELLDRFILWLEQLLAKLWKNWVK